MKNRKKSVIMNISASAVNDKHYESNWSSASDHHITSDQCMLMMIRKSLSCPVSVCVCACESIRRVQRYSDVSTASLLSPQHTPADTTHSSPEASSPVRHRQDFRKLYYTAYIIKHLITSLYDRPGWRAAGVDEEASLAGNDRQGASRSSRNIRVLYECHWQR